MRGRHRSGGGFGFRESPSPGQDSLHIQLKYDDRRPAITGLKRVSRPGLRVQVQRKEVPRAYGGIGNPQGGGSEPSFSNRRLDSGSPGTTRTSPRPAQAPSAAGTPTNAS